MADDSGRVAPDDDPADGSPARGTSDDADAPAVGDDADAKALDDDTGGTETGDGPPVNSSGGPGGRPEVVVPMDLYKTVTVFSTLFAVALVVGGMVALDAATGRATYDADEISLPVAFLGVAAIVLGAAVYAFAARFRAEGMGNPKDADDER